MPRTPRKAGTYYERTCEQRLEYQRIYYAAMKEKLARKRELERELDPEKHARYLEYQKAYYQKRKASRRA